MSIARYILRSLLFHWRTHLGVFLGALLAAAILTGSLSVGDSVRYSLRKLALARLGKTTVALGPSENFFREKLASQIAEQSQADVAPLLMLRGTVALPDGSARANNVQIVGVDARFWMLGNSADLLAGAGEEFVANDRLAAQLGLKPGDAVIIRVEEPQLLSRDAPLSGAADASVAIRSKLKSIAGTEQFGCFSLQANQVSPMTVFLPLAVLQKNVNKPERANLVLVDRINADAANAALRKTWTLADLNLEVRALQRKDESGTQEIRTGKGKSGTQELRKEQTTEVSEPEKSTIAMGGSRPPGAMVSASPANTLSPLSATKEKGGSGTHEITKGEGSELRTDRVFLDPGLEATVLKAVPGASGVLTYLVNEIRKGERTTPYSMVTAADFAVGQPQLADDEIAINAWLAEDLDAKPGDEVSLRYFVVADNRQLVEKTSRFKVRAILPMESLDASWMPSFPGLADEENCRDWHPGIPLDMSRIRPKDEAYWKQYRGTPKAFLNLHSGQAIWANRFGDLTAVRYPLGASSVERALHDSIDPTKAGLSFQPVRELALKASDGAQDFGQLFAGFSFFLVIAALLLMAMLFVFSLEQRTTEAGLLLALGFGTARVRRLFLWEGCLLALLGVLCGAAAGVIYAKLALHGLSTVWRGAANLSEFSYHTEWQTLLLGAALSIAAAVLATWLAGRGQARRSAAVLLASGAEKEQMGTRPGRWSLWTGILSLAVAGVLLAFCGRSAEVFFGAGALLLCAGILLSRALLGKLASTGTTARSVMAIGIRGAARRPGRSLTTIAVLASGIFIVIAVGAFREDPLSHESERSSGTGGFALFGQSTLPVYEPLEGSVAMRFNGGDDASCLNLNRAQQPSFLGVHPEQLAARKAFTFIDGKGGWDALNQPQPDGAVPAIGDEATTRWGLDKSVGETLSCTDGQGNEFRVRIVGVIANSVLQGSLVISDKNFVQRFPSVSGNRVFLIDASPNNTKEISGKWMSSFGGRGLELVPAWRRLAEFQAVESSYIGIFEALGGLGLLLGSAGLGIVVMRNVFERRGELALLLAVGFQPRSVRWLVVCEHWFLVLLGVGIGGIAAAVAVLPSVLSPGIHASPVGPVVTLGFLAGLGIAWSWLAAWLALRGSLLDSLRNE